MAITVNEIAYEVSGFIGVQPTSAVFAQYIIPAVNHVSRDLTHKCFIDYPGDVASLQDSIDVDAKYRNFYVSGVNYYLQKNPVFSKKSEYDFLADYRREMAMAQKDAIDDLDPVTGRQESNWGE